jgi:hypothetical protein
MRQALPESSWGRQEMDREGHHPSHRGVSRQTGRFTSATSAAAYAPSRPPARTDQPSALPGSTSNWHAQSSSRMTLLPDAPMQTPLGARLPLTANVPQVFSAANLLRPSAAHGSILSRPLGSNPSASLPQPLTREPRRWAPSLSCPLPPPTPFSSHLRPSALAPNLERRRSVAASTAFSSTIN